MSCEETAYMNVSCFDKLNLSMFAFYQRTKTSNTPLLCMWYLQCSTQTMLQTLESQDVVHPYWKDSHKNTANYIIEHSLSGFSAFILPFPACWWVP